MEGYFRLALIFVLVAIIVLIIWQLNIRRTKNKETIIPIKDFVADPVFHNMDDDPHFDRESFREITEDILKMHETANADADSASLAEPQVSAPAKFTGNLLVLSVFAKSGCFSSYDLIQSIAATGMQFGEMNIFHYYQRDPQGKKSPLFSLASATHPGEFDLDRMGDFSCVGLTLFMDINQGQNPLQAFCLMVNTAEQLAEDLDGELRVDPKTPWSDQYFQEYQQRILDLTDQPEIA